MINYCPVCKESKHIYSYYRDGGSTLYCGNKNCDPTRTWPNPDFKRLDR